MKIFLTIILLTISLIAIGQRKSLLGKYTYSVFMCEYFLTLADSGKYIVEEDSDVGLKIITGTWTVDDGLIKLVPTKCIWYSRSPEDEGKKFEIPLNLLENESLISVDKENNLTELALKKRADSIRYKIPGHKLTKVHK